MMTRNAQIVLAVLLAGCGATVSHPLPAVSQERLDAAATAPEAFGSLVYDGQVRPRHEPDELLFRYERRVQATDAGWVGTHLTFVEDAAVVLHQATYSSDYVLESFEEVHGQTGLVGRLTVDGEGRADFTVTVGGQSRHRVEGPGDPVHVGPSLFGFALENWDDLVAGDVKPFRFAVMHDAKTYRFALRVVECEAGSTCFQMAAVSPMVRMVVPAMVLTFDTESRQIQRYEGMVPPMTGSPDALSTLDARVDYQLASERYW